MIKNRPHTAKSNLIPSHGGYRELRSFQHSELVYDATVKFCDRFIDKVLSWTMVQTADPQKFFAALKKVADPKAVPNVSRFFWSDPNGHSSDNKVLGVSIGKIFPIAKQFADMPLERVEQLLDNPYYEVRMGAVSIMDFQARNKKTTPEHRKALFNLYIGRHDRINNWDLVDRAAPYVVGGVPRRQVAQGSLSSGAIA